MAFAKGYETVDKEEKRQALAYGPDRFFLKKGEKKDIIFVDDEPCQIEEYNPRMNGGWKNWITSPKSDPEYPNFEEAMSIINDAIGGTYKPYFVVYYTVVDLTEWKDKKGNVHKYETKLFPAKLTAAKLLKTRSADFGGLARKMVRVQRVGEKASSVGDIFDMVKEVTEEQLFDRATYKGKSLKDRLAKANSQDQDAEKERELLLHTFNWVKKEGVLQPRMPIFNYESVLRIKTPKELRDFFKGQKIEAANSGSSEDDFDDAPTGDAGAGNGKADADVPF